ncbi:hypothetical protein D3C87_2096770 [compost metagenome]
MCLRQTGLIADPAQHAVVQQQRRRLAVAPGKCLPVRAGGGGKVGLLQQVQTVAKFQIAEKLQPVRMEGCH